MEAGAVALCVDLDGTLIRSDLLVESAIKAAKQRPFALLSAIAAFPSGRARFKQRLADAVDLSVEQLPYDASVVAFAESARAMGCTVVLATASNRKFADRVAEHLGIFDAVYASDDQVNLSGSAKADKLVRVFGEKRFDYVGDSVKDLVVWKRARRALVANPQFGVIKALQREGVAYEVLCRRGPVAGAMLRALRPHQWLKNALVFVPLLAAHLYFDPHAVLSTLAAFLAFGAAASAGYIVNDLFDLESDRHHARKRHRPFASGDLPITFGLASIPALIAFGIALGGLLPPLFLVVLGGYFVGTLAYSLYLKRRATLDVLTLAGLYTLRVLGGTAAIGVPPSFWLLAFSVFLFLSLAYLKRYAELEALRREGGDWASGRGYGVRDLELVRSLGIPAGYGAVMVLALYINSPEVRVLYRVPELIWLLCPLLLFWMARTWAIAHRGLMHDDPLVFAVEDRASQATLAICALVLWLAI